MAQGLTANWLLFSCRVQLTRTTVNGVDSVQVATDDRPDYLSVYFPSGDPCHESDTTPTFPDPNTITAQNITVVVPIQPTAQNGSTATSLGAIGVAINGVAIFNAMAAPGDDIFQEAQSFDRCQGHPAPGGTYHYHTEPFAISQDDANLIGVLRDGYFVYGRKDYDGTTPSDLLASYGGHTGSTSAGGAPVFHYHAHLETNGTESAYFLAPTLYYGTPGS